MSELLYPLESRTLVGLVMQLHRELGCGFKEKVYQDAFEVLLKENGISYIREYHMRVEYHGVTLAHDFYFDFLCYGKIGIELKAISELSGEFEAQTINYLYVGNIPLGLLVNFGRTSLEYKWYANRKDYYTNRFK